MNTAGSVAMFLVETHNENQKERAEGHKVARGSHDAMSARVQKSRGIIVTGLFDYSERNAITASAALGVESGGCR